MDAVLLRVFGALGASTVTGGRSLLWACAREARTSTDTKTIEPNIVALIAAALPNQRSFLSDKATPTNDDPQFRRTESRERAQLRADARRAMRTSMGEAIGIPHAQNRIA
ncbi:hypothetical protein [Bradyrhizobium huanghuaihaiense]|uniref:hypothetical protein n=1 Tax=Bradyrhizobium huanghuaihaiense TaxID=990078 RepID=UPI001FCE2FEA|nr:hypothetical protein [Bradyrhizobium huanghuaihaiense]